MQREYDIFDPRDLLNYPDQWLRRQALSYLACNPRPDDRIIFEEYLCDSDGVMAFFAFLGLKKLFPGSIKISAIWKDLFEESINLLSERAGRGPAFLRIAAIQALCFAPCGVSPALADSIAVLVSESLNTNFCIPDPPPELPLIRPSNPITASDCGVMILASLQSPSERLKILRRELNSIDSNKLLPALSYLQMNPIPDLADLILPLIRSPETAVAEEAARAFTACGGKRVFVLLLSLLNETADRTRKSSLLKLLAGTGKPEIWPVISRFTAHSSHELRLAAARAASIFPASPEDKTSLIQPLLKDPTPAVRACAAQMLWNLGSMEALATLEEMIDSDNSADRSAAASAFSAFPQDVALPRLIERFAIERSGDVIRTLVLALRSLSAKSPPPYDSFMRISALLSKYLNSGDTFIRSQIAVLCGFFGLLAEELIVSSLVKQDHPHVIASLLGALGRIGSSRLIVVSRYHDHPDPRVRANLINALSNAGSSAVPYLSSSLKDPSPRVRASAAGALFLMGQFEVVGIINRMLLIPSTTAVLAACYALGKILRINPSALRNDHALQIALIRKLKPASSCEKLPETIYDVPELPGLFLEMSIAHGDPEKISWILENTAGRIPAAYAPRRMLAAVQTITEKYADALKNLEICMGNRPGILADLLDAYRLSLLAGNLEKADKHGKTAGRIYREIHRECLEISRKIRGEGIEGIMERVLSLSNPSMNLYNAMIQIKSLQGESETVMELMSELMFARPTNAMIGRKLAAILPERMSELASALRKYTVSLDLSEAKETRE